MNTKKLSEQIIEAVGGLDNIQTMTHCMTRLRFILKDESVVNDQKVESLDGVMGIMKKSGQYQIIIGNEVISVYKELSKVVKGSTELIEEEKKKDYSLKSIGKAIIDLISGSLTMILPAIVACGMVKLICSLLAIAHLDTNSTYQVLNVLGDTGFYFLPLLVAYAAAKRLNTNIILSLVVTAFLIHPSLIMMFTEGNVDFLGFPVYAATYSSSIIPPLFAVWLVSIVDPFIDKITPNWSKSFLNPTLVLLICVPLVLCIFGPLGALIGDGLSFVFQWAKGVCPWLTIGVIAAIYPLLVFTGMHYALNPIMYANLANPGYDNIMLPVMLCSNLAQAAACFAVMIKSKDSKLKSVSATAGISAAVAGITEPAMFGVTVRLRTPLIACVIGAGCAGIFAGIVDLKSYVLAVPSLASIIQFISPDDSMNIVYAIITAAISIVLTFVLTLIVYKEDTVEEIQKISNEEENKSFSDQKEMIYAPMSGKVVALEDVNDETFSKKMLGDGCAIIPTEGKVYAPFDGTVKMFFNTGHAMGLESENGTEILIHVGLDTVTLDGEGFTKLVSDGDKFKKGDVLLEFDLDAIKNKGFDMITPIICTNGMNKNIDVTFNQDLMHGETMMAIEQKEE